MLSKSKTNRSSLPKTKDVSMQHLATLSNFLEGQQSQTQYINKEIKKEVELALKNEGLVKKAIQKINDDAQSLACRYEEEKERNEKLEFLVKHIQSEILSAKIQKANNLKQNIESDKLVELTEVLLEKEKELEKICEKSNSQSYQLAKKTDAIRSLRSQRTIFSDLFDKLERELCNLQHCYKILVIQSKIQNRQIQQKIEEFNQCQHNANKQFQKLYACKHQSKQRKRQPWWSINTNKSQALSTKQGQKTTVNALSTAEPERKKVPSFNRQQLQKQFRKKEKSLKYENLVEKLARQKRVKIILNEFGVTSIKELPQDIDQLNKINENLLNQNQLFFNSIQKIDQKLQNLSKKKKTKKTGFNRKAILQTKTAAISNFQAQISKSKLEMIEFNKTCKILLQKLRQDQLIDAQQQQFFNVQEQLAYGMGQLQKCMQKSYAFKGVNCLEKTKKARPQMKRLASYLLVSNHYEKNNFSIYEEKDLLDIAQKDMEKLNRPDFQNNLRFKSEGQ